jgi:carbon storage regulator
MLMMRRRAGETILIGDHIEIHIAHVGRSRVKLGIQAPRHVRVVAKEVEMVRAQNVAAASAPDPHAVRALARSLACPEFESLHLK